MKTTNIKLILPAILAAFTLSCSKPVYTVVSPDKSMKIEIKTSGEQLYYMVTKGNHAIIDTSEIVWTINDITFGTRTDKITEVEKKTENTEYPTVGIHSLAIDHCNTVSYKISSNGIPDFLLEVKAFDDGVAFRYVAEYDGESSVDDFTTFVLPRKSEVWYQGDVNYYEGTYVRQNAENLKVDQLAGPPVVIKDPQTGIYSAITEAGLYDFAGMALQATGEQTFKARLSGKTIKRGKIETPWRVIMAGDLNTLVNNDIITNLSEKPSEELFKGSSGWIKPGKCVWSWLTEYNIRSKYSVTFEDMKTFSKLAGELGFEYNLVDEGWGSWKQGDKDCWAMMKELVDYSAAYGVKIWAWKAYPDRKGIPGLQTVEKRREFFKKCKEIGVVGLKIDFFDNEGQDITKFYQDALKDAAEYQLMLNFHGCNKPTGLNRTFPNELSREGIRGNEGGVNVDCDVTLPFTRLIAGHGDFTPLFLNEEMMGGTSWPHQIASAFAFSSPLLCLAANPDDILANPSREFICSMPTVWDETIVLPPSEIGELVLLAKRKGKEWYIAGMTKEEQTGLTINLSFLGQGTYNAHLIKDTSGSQVSATIEDIQVTANRKLPVTMNPKGGFVAKISPAQ